MPAATPVTKPPAFTVAAEAFRLDHENVIPDKVFPYWSKPVALKLCVAPTRMLALAGATVIVVKTEGAFDTVNVTSELLTPAADAEMFVVPAETPVATPEFIVAAALLLDQVNVGKGENRLPFWSSPLAENACVPPTYIAALEGVTESVVSTGDSGADVPLLPPQPTNTKAKIKIALTPFIRFSLNQLHQSNQVPVLSRLDLLFAQVLSYNPQVLVLD
ncbi:MAG: hypothetical protein WCC99_20470 [Candidatus Sulfotelmatobacter sp.]